MNYSIPFVCAFGMITVFLSLIVIVVLSSAMSAVVRKLDKPAAATPAKTTVAAPAPVAKPVAVAAAPEQDPQLMAAITAAIAEDMGVSFSNVHITAIKKV
jgi:sodium pump decarboxylase gamma subunit